MKPSKKTGEKAKDLLNEARQRRRRLLQEMALKCLQKQDWTSQTRRSEEMVVDLQKDLWYVKTKYQHR
jgi:hypothetical protein